MSITYFVRNLKFLFETLNVKPVNLGEKKNRFWKEKASFLKQVTVFNTMTKVSKCNQTSLFYLEKNKVWFGFVVKVDLDLTT